MKVLLVLRDDVNGHVDLVKVDGGYVLRHWNYPLGAKICIVSEIKLETHEMMALLQTLLDEVDEWRKSA